MSRARAAFVLFVLGCVLGWVQPLAAEDTRERPARVRKSRAKTSRANKSRGKTADPAQQAAAPAPADGPAPSAPAASPSLAAADDADVKKEGDTEVKVVEFSGLDIEGQLKTPQMLYFLNRLRAEFGRPRLPHRSFLPELERSTKDEEF